MGVRVEAQEIISLLDSDTITIKGTPISERQFTGVALLSGPMSMTLRNKDVVFFSPVSYFNSLPNDFIDDRLFFLYVDEPLKPLSPNSSIVLISHRNDWLESFEFVAQEFT